MCNNNHNCTLPVTMQYSRKAGSAAIRLCIWTTCPCSRHRRQQTEAWQWKGPDQGGQPGHLGVGLGWDASAPQQRLPDPEPASAFDLQPSNTFVTTAAHLVHGVVGPHRKMLRHRTARPFGKWQRTVLLQSSSCMMLSPVLLMACRCQACHTAVYKKCL